MKLGKGIAFLLRAFLTSSGEARPFGGSDLGKFFFMPFALDERPV